MSFVYQSGRGQQPSADAPIARLDADPTMEQLPDDRMLAHAGPRADDTARSVGEYL